MRPLGSGDGAVVIECPLVLSEVQGVFRSRSSRYAGWIADHQAVSLVVQTLSLFESSITVWLAQTGDSWPPSTLRGCRG